MATTASFFDYIQLAITIIMYIAFLCWIYRISKNLHELSDTPMRFSSGWAVGWFFIPIANLIIPYQVMIEIWEVCHKKLNIKHTIINCWWTIWIISTLAIRMVTPSDTSSVIFIINIIGNLLNILLYIIALILVTQLEVIYSKNFIEQ